MSDRPDTDPHELPDVDPDAAPAIPGPPLLPTIDREAVTMPPAHELPTPKVKLRREVVEALRRAEAAVREVKEAHRHSINEPVNIVDALEKLNELSDAKAAARLAAHEDEEKENAEKLARQVKEVEQKAAEERSVLRQKIDELPRIIKESATSVADRFLERIDTLISELHAVKQTVMGHEVRIEKLKGEIANVKQRLVGLEERIDQLERAVHPKNVDDVTP